jgi:hypothetical protein
MQRPPIVTFTTDFGTRDAYVAAMKAAVVRECPEARLIDITHETSRHDVLAGSILLERAVSQFRGCGDVVHLAVVDPGVGSSRAVLAARIELEGETPYLVCPDNGLITWTLRRHADRDRTIWRAGDAPVTASPVFGGRDVMAPLAGRLARGGLEELGFDCLAEPVLLDLHPVRPGEAGGRVIHIDHFGNCTTNVVIELRGAARHHVRVAGRDLGPLRRTYGDVAPGEPLALIGSSDLIEIAVREGSAASVLGIGVGAEVLTRRSD